MFHDCTASGGMKKEEEKEEKRRESSEKRLRFPRRSPPSFIWGTLVKDKGIFSVHLPGKKKSLFIHLPFP